MTNRITSPAVGLLLGLALLLGLGSQPAAAAKKIPVNLRVVTWQGKIVFDGTIRTGTTKVKPTSACPSLGGRRGPARVIEGATGIGLLYQGSLKYKALRPLKISDSDFGFGICGIGGNMVKDKEWWLLRHNYKDAASGAETLKVKRGDSVLFYLAKSWEDPNNPDSLFLKVPNYVTKKRIKKGAKVRVRVFSYTGAGKRSPVAGATVRGAEGRPTNARGYTRLKITRRTRLVVRKAGLIPSNRVPVRLKRNNHR